MKITEIITEAVKQRLDPKCWKGKHKEGTKIKGGIRVNNCVPNESVEEAANAAQQAAIAIAKKKKQGVAEGVDIGQEWMSDTELDQYVPDRLQQQWRELLGYDEDGNPSALWANLTGGYEPDINDPQHRALMVKVANKWFAAKKIPNVKFFNVKDSDDELEWLVQIGQQGVAEGSKPDAYGRTGEKHECGSCDGTGIDTHDDECSECGGKGWVRDKKSLKKQGVAEGLPQTLRKVVPGYAKREIDRKMDAEKFGKTDVDRDANYYRYKKIQDKLKDQGVAEGLSLDEQFDVIEAMVEAFALYHGVDSEQIWEDFESVDDLELLDESAAWKRSAGKSKKGGLNAKGVASYRRENPGSKLQMAVTTKPSKLKPGSKAAKRRKSFCARMGGNPGPMKKPNGKPTRKALALRKWNC